MPVWNVLERGDWKFDLVLVNPQHVRALPGRKTDRKDCKRLAELGQYDLLRGSFIPPRHIRELRDLTRQRSHMQGDRNRVVNRIGRLLETANFKLSSVVSNIVGKTGWLILKAIAAGETDPQQLAEQAQGSLQWKKAELAQALHGYATDHFRWLLRQLLGELSRLDGKLDELDARIRDRMRPHADLARKLSTIPGVKETTAWTLIAELGTDMSRFPDADHAASWAGLCPGNCESAGKRQSGRTRKGDRYLRRILIQNAWAVSHKNDCFLTALFFRVASHRGLKRAAMAVAHRVLIIAYHIIRDGTEYREIGGDHYDRRNPEKTAQRLTRRLERIGYKVTLTKPAEIAEETGKLRKLPRNGTNRWKVSKSRRSAYEKAAPATPDVCRKCAAWGIARIHVRNANSQSPETLNSEDSTA
jgi:transposase